MAPSPNKFPLGGMGKEERGRLKSSQATLLLFVASIQILPGMLFKQLPFRYVKVYITGKEQGGKNSHSEARYHNVVRYYSEWISTLTDESNTSRRVDYKMESKHPWKAWKKLQPNCIAIKHGWSTCTPTLHQLISVS